jgi:type IV pilus assembly protein PilA
MSTPQRGFTLIELLIVIGIIAILLLLAVPSSQARIARDQILEALPLADLAKKTIAGAWALAQVLPADNAAAGLPTADKIVSNLVSSVQVESGAVHVTFGNHASGLLKGKVLTLRPAVVEDAPVVPVAWVCGYATAPEKMTAKGPDKTNVPEGYLPRNCRGK